MRSQKTATRPLGPLLLSLSAALLTPEARAWDRETHVAIVNAALRISPAAEAHLPADFRDAVFSNTQNADPLDKPCREHPTLEPPRDPVSQAAQLYEQLVSGKGLERPYNRAIALGRFLHFVADSAMPSGFIERPELDAEFWINRNLVIFRDPRPLKPTFSEGLRARHAQAAWADDSSSAWTSSFRIAVNLVADALLLLPVRPDAKSGPDAGPVIFVVNRLDTGMGGAKTWETRRYGGYTRRGFDWVPYDWVYTWKLSTPNAGKRQAFLPGRSGLQIVEWTSRTAGDTQSVRALLLNNDDKCATHFVLTRKTWKVPLPGKLAPRAFGAFEFKAPADVDPANVTGSFDVYACSAPFPSDLGIQSVRRLVIGSTGRAPVIDGRVQETEAEDTSQRPFQMKPD